MARCPRWARAGYANAQVTAGGLDTRDFDPRTLRVAQGVPACSRRAKCLDVDGPCGGYNLQWAWASGLAGRESAGGKGSKS